MGADPNEPSEPKPSYRKPIVANLTRRVKSK